MKPQRQLRAMFSAAAILLAVFSQTAKAATVSLDPPTTPVAVAGTSLQLLVSFDRASVTPPATLQLTFILTNVGSSTATGLAIDNLLPVEFSYVSGHPDELKNLGELAPGDTISKTYAVSVPASVKTNRYVDEAIASAANTDSIESTAALDVNNGKVLGATDSTVAGLATTGQTPLVVMALGLLLMVAGARLLRIKNI